MSEHPGLKRAMDWTPVDLSARKSLRSRQYLESHKVIEKRRRDRINNYLQAIKSLLPTCMFNMPNDKRLDKADILNMTLLYLRMINSFLNNLGVNDLFCAVQQQLSLLTASEKWIRSNSKNYSSVPEFVADLLKFIQSEQDKASKLATDTILKLGGAPLKGPFGRQGCKKSTPSELLKSGNWEYKSTSACCSTVVKNGPQRDVRSTEELRSCSKFHTGELKEQLYSPVVNGLGPSAGCSYMQLEKPDKNVKPAVQEPGNSTGASGGWPASQPAAVGGCDDETVGHAIPLMGTCHGENVVNKNQTSTTKQRMSVTSEMNTGTMTKSSKADEDEWQKDRVDLTESKGPSVDVALSVMMPFSNLGHSERPGGSTQRLPCSGSSDVASVVPKVLCCVQNPDSSEEVIDTDSDAKSEQSGPKHNSNPWRSKCHCDFKVLVRDQGVNTDGSKDRSFVDKELKLKVDTGQLELDVSSLILQAQSQDGSLSLPVTFKGQVCLDIGDKKPE